MEYDKSTGFDSALVENTSSSEHIPLHQSSNLREESEENNENGNHSASVIGSYFLQVPNLFGISAASFSRTDTNNEHTLPILFETRKRSSSCHNVQTSGDSSPTRKFSLNSVNANKGNLTSISRIGALSSNFLNASISNIHRYSSTRTLRSFFHQVERSFNLS